jgi:hypothetical protein
MNVSENTDLELKELLAERAIRSVLNAYCQGVDRQNWEQVRDCYHDDAEDSHGAFVGGPDELLEYIKARHVYVSSSIHILSNVWVKLSADGRFARAESYCISLQVVEPGGNDAFAGSSDERQHVTIACRYVDTFENRSDIGWRIRKRDVLFDWMRRDSDAGFSPLDPTWTKSKRDSSDLLWAPLPIPTETTSSL